VEKSFLTHIDVSTIRSGGKQGIDWQIRMFQTLANKNYIKKY